MSPAIEAAWIIKKCDGAACVALCVVQASLDYIRIRHIPQAIIEIDAGKLWQKAPKSFGGHEITMRTSLSAFSYYIEVASASSVTLEYRGSSEDISQELEVRRQWISIGLERLAEIIERRPLIIYRSNSEGSAQPISQVVLELTGYMLPQHIWSWLMLTLGEVTFVLGFIDETYKPSAIYLFDAVMFDLERLANEFEDEEWGRQPSWDDLCQVQIDRLYCELRF